MTWLPHAISFMLGWAGCCAFVALVEWLTPLEPVDPMAEPHGDCAWPVDPEFEAFHPANDGTGAQPNHG